MSNIRDPPSVEEQEKDTLMGGREWKLFRRTEQFY